MLPPNEFITVKQPPGSKVCTAAVAAMAVGRPLEYAIDRMYPSEHNGKPFYPTRELLKFLGAHGIYSGLLLAPNKILQPDSTLDLYVEIADHPAIMTIDSRNYPGFFHFVFWDGKVIRDPDSKFPDTTPIEDYDILDVMFLTYIDES